MLRTRSLDRWETVINHNTPHSFLASPIQSGVHVIDLEESTLDILIEDRGAAVTIVVFPSAMPAAVATYPAFQGEGLAANHSFNLVSVSDPTLELGDVDLGWHLGNKKTGPLKPILDPILKHAVQSLGGQRTILFGSSGGAYAALHHADALPGSLVVAINPRLDLAAPPEKAFARYALIGYGAGKFDTQQRLLRRLAADGPARRYADGLPFHLCIFQNSGDTIYLDKQLRPFSDARSDDPKLFLRVEHTAVGHKGIPSGALKGMLNSLVSSNTLSDSIAKAGFVPASELTGSLHVTTAPQTTPAVL